MHGKESVTTDPDSVQSVVSSLKYGGLGLKKIGYHFGITDPKAKQKMDFFRQTGGVLWRLDRHATIGILMYAAEAQAEMDPAEMSEREILIRERMLTGRMDTARTNGRQRG